MWVIGYSLVVLARIFRRAAVRDAYTVSVIIKTCFEPYALAEWIDDAMIDVPSEHVHQVFRVTH